jgi:hypothetical protein
MEKPIAARRGTSGRSAVSMASCSMLTALLPITRFSGVSIPSSPSLTRWHHSCEASRRPEEPLRSGPHRP